MTEEVISQEIQALTAKPEQYKNYLLNVMIDYKGSDMYLTVGEPPAIRIQETIYRINKLPKLTSQSIKEMAYMFMDEHEGEKFRETLDIDLGASYSNRRFRINISKQQKNIMIVIRLLAGTIPSIDDLGLPDEFKSLIQRKSGIIILSGPTGCGKSTTLAAMINEINNKYTKHIITIEDPIEYIFTPNQSIIEQKQLGTDIISFSQGLKSALRQKPDVILFGEMRDTDSISNAVTLAETGHLVLTTTHSKSAAQTINKIIDSFPSEQQNQIKIQLSETLAAIISQRLIKRKDKKGVILAQERLVNNYAISNLIRENKIHQINNIIQTNKLSGMCLLEDNLIELFLNDLITYEDTIINANNPSYVKTELNNRGIKAE